MLNGGLLSAFLTSWRNDEGSDQSRCWSPVRLAREKDKRGEDCSVDDINMESILRAGGMVRTLYQSHNRHQSHSKADNQPRG
jgi:hypothetical protein